MKLKLCGIRTAEMARACQGGQVDYIGLNFVPSSKRRVLRVPEISEGHRFQVVGVFQDQRTEFIKRMTDEAELDIIQLHGQESPEFIEKIQQKIPEAVVWKAISVDQNLDENLLQAYCKKCELILFDSKKAGSGQAIENREKLNQAILIAKQSGAKIGIAGGINADNVAAFREDFPEAWLLDTASGIEVRGDFDADETRRLIKNFEA